MEPEINRAAFARDLNRKIVREHIGLLMSHTTGF
jgi:hypothetical protein